jgi:hypothetical protein
MKMHRIGISEIFLDVLEKMQVVTGDFFVNFPK